ncbi:hypothetical protein T02_2008 [Trichinella nativa]|uniref:Uncharacterized protein n=1 Tax=Trichinella nativa TaxID=6335 RepID=A0A0V1LWI3_9BILA|nr:hypothetical protein T02_2008 [Trichinella nativa]
MSTNDRSITYMHTRLHRMKSIMTHVLIFFAYVYEASYSRLGNYWLLFISPGSSVLSKKTSILQIKEMVSLVIWALK